MVVASDDEVSPLELLNRRILGIADDAVSVIEELLRDEDSNVRLNAAKTILDRAGVTAKARLELGGQVQQTHVLDAEIDLLLGGLIAQRTRASEIETGRILELRTAPLELEPATDSSNPEPEAPHSPPSSGDA